MPGQSDPAKEPSGRWEGWRNDPIVKPAAPSTAHGPWETTLPRSLTLATGKALPVASRPAGRLRFTKCRRSPSRARRARNIR
jgi:hypothetical protein